MARQNISIGSAANDGTGDTLRQAAQKINETFLEIYQKFGDSDNLSQIVSFVTAGIEFNLGTSYTLTALAPPTVDRTILLDDATGTITLNEATQTLINKTLVTPTISSPKISTALSDASGNEFIKLSAAASAVNEITLANAATGANPTITASGTDANINIVVNPKGDGSIAIGKVSFSSGGEVTSADNDFTQTNSHVICNNSVSPFQLDMNDGTTSGELVIFTNKGSQIVTVVPDNFANGTQFALDQFDTATLIWDGTNWYIVSHYGATIT